MDYVSILNELSRLNFNLEQEMNECNNLSSDNDAEAGQIIKILTGYQELLGNRINALQCIIGKPHDKAEATGEKYSIFAYKSDMKHLGQMEKQNDMIGNVLQINAVPFMNRYRQIIHIANIK